MGKVEATVKHYTFCSDIALFFLNFFNFFFRGIGSHIPGVAQV